MAQPPGQKFGLKLFSFGNLVRHNNGGGGPDQKKVAMGEEKFCLPGSQAREHDRAMIAKVVERWAAGCDDDFTLWIDAADLMWAQYLGRIQPARWGWKAKAVLDGAVFTKMNSRRKTRHLWIRTK